MAPSPLSPKQQQKPKRFLSKQNANLFFSKVKEGVKNIAAEERARQETLSKLPFAAQAKETLLRRPAKILGSLAQGFAGGIQFLGKSGIEAVGGEKLRSQFDNPEFEKKVFGREVGTAQQVAEKTREFVTERGGTPFERKALPLVAAIGSIGFESPGNPFKGFAKKAGEKIGEEIVKEGVEQGVKREIAKESITPTIQQTLKNIQNTNMPKEEFVRRFDDAVQAGNTNAIEVKKILDAQGLNAADLHDQALGVTAKAAPTGTPEEILRQAEERVGVKPVEQIEPQPVLRPQEAPINEADLTPEQALLKERQARFKDSDANIKKEFEKEQEQIRMGNQAADDIKMNPPEKTGIFASIKKGLKPFKYADDASKTAYKTWESKTLTGRAIANKEVDKLANIPKNEGEAVMKAFEKGEATQYSAQIKKAFDDLFEEANRRGLETKYRSNYIPHVYAQSPNEIQKRIYAYLKDKGLPEDDIISYMKGEKNLTDDQARALKITPSFDQARVFSTYEEAAKYGLTPKYKHPGQLLAHYREELEKALANKEFIDELAAKGRILVDQVAPREWKYINAPSFQGYKAPKYLASIIDDMFQAVNQSPFMEAIQKGIGGTANLSRRAQEIALSGGIPLTNINFFSIGQTIKELTRGNTKAASAFIRANSNNASVKWLTKNSKYLDMMAQEGIDLGDHIASFGRRYDSVIDKINPLKAETWKQFWGDKKAFDTLFNEKTFSSFMPQMHTQVFKSTYEKALKKGMDEVAAKKLAGDVTKKTFGLIEEWGRSKGTKDALSAVFFAPRFRESILNTLFNTGASVTTKMFNPAFKNNRKLALGMVVTFAAYNALNKELNGHYMWENPENRKFALRIPNEKGAMYIEFMPSFLAFARNLVQGGISLAKGDFKNAGQKIGSVFSMPIKTVSEVMSNQDYFGREIYKDTDTTAQKIGKMVAYTGTSINHPFIKEMIKHFGLEFTSKAPFVKAQPKTERPPLWQSLITAAELPVKFGTKEREATNQYYDELEERSAKMAQENKKYKKTLDEIRSLRDSGDTAGAEAIYNALTDEEKAIVKRISSAEKAKETKQRKVELYQTLLDIREATSSGDTARAEEIYNALSEDDQKLLQTVSKEHPKE